MIQPAPEDWWASLDEEDRQEFTAAAKQPFLSPELATKLTAAGVLVAWQVPGTKAVFPQEYRDYADDQSDGDGNE